MTIIHKTTPAVTHTVRSSWQNPHTKGGYRDTTVNVGHSSISYEDGPRYYKDGSLRWKRCHHIRYEYRNHNEKYSYVVNDGINNVQEVGNLSPWGFVTIDPEYRLATRVPDPAKVMYGDALRDHVNEVYGIIPPDMLSLENVSGFITGRSFVKSAGNALKSLARLAGKDRSFFQAVKAVTGAHLGWKFSVETTVRDVKRTFSLPRRYQEYLQKINFRNKTDWVRFKTTTANTERNEIRFVVQQGERAFLDWNRWPTYAQPRFGTVCTEYLEKRSEITLYSSAKVRYPSTFSDFSRFLQQTWGLDRPLSTVWAIVPLSFVVDYFVSIETLLDELDSQLNRTEVSVLNHSRIWSCQKDHSLWRFGCDPGPCGYNWGNTPEITGQMSGFTMVYKTSSYHRQPVSSNSLFDAWWNTRSLSARQSTNLAELFIQFL